MAFCPFRAAFYRLRRWLFVTCLRRLRLFAACGGGKTKNKVV